eukprot:TRINITY_DN38069_c0_g1_i1.p1 TRINITY_DN38069_c0_g1~~TRINITY_DN38069_c0_g1_i1.p1  ORF type:complete len:156 (+),score=30.41 TRINITY_DN38069_c0_g1_i1:168-635(+)
MPYSPGKPATLIAEPPKPRRDELKAEIQKEDAVKSDENRATEVRQTFVKLVQSIVEQTISRNDTGSRSCFASSLLSALTPVDEVVECVPGEDTPVIGEQLCIEVTPASPPLFEVTPSSRRMIPKSSKRRRSASSIRSLEISDEELKEQEFFECTS